MVFYVSEFLKCLVMLKVESPLGWSTDPWETPWLPAPHHPAPLQGASRRQTSPLDTPGPQQTLPIFSGVSPGLVGECHKQNSSDSSGFQLMLFIPHLCHTCTLDPRTPQAPYDTTCSCLQGSHKDSLQEQFSFHFPAVNILPLPFVSFINVLKFLCFLCLPFLCCHKCYAFLYFCTLISVRS